MPNSLNMSDKIVVISEQLAEMLRDMMNRSGLSNVKDAYLEEHVNAVLSKI